MCVPKLDRTPSTTRRRLFFNCPCLAPVNRVPTHQDSFWVARLFWGTHYNGFGFPVGFPKSQNTKGSPPKKTDLNKKVRVRVCLNADEGFLDFVPCFPPPLGENLWTPRLKAKKVFSWIQNPDPDRIITSDRCIWGRIERSTQTPNHIIIGKFWRALFQGSSIQALSFRTAFLA